MILNRLMTGLAAVIFTLSLVGEALSAETLSRPAGIEPYVAFWRTVFAEITSEQALVHDNRELGVVYTVVELPKNVSNRQRRKIADQIRSKYRTILKDIASGDRSGLTTEQKRVLAMWPRDVTDTELRAAAERIRFQQGLSDRFLDGLIRSGRWEDYILTRLKKAGVPAELSSLPHVESSYNPAARSHVGASGLWQFTRPTGRRFMQIDHVVDERRDPYASSDAAAALLQYNYSILKSWPLAITAYNHGAAGMRRAVKQTGSDDIEVIIREYKGRAFGFASRNFYVAFLAANDVVENAEDYFGEFQKEPPIAQTVIPMVDYVTVDTLTDSLGVSESTLQQYNPALLESVWSGLKYVPRGFELRIPVSTNADELLASIPAGARFSAQTPDLEHRVQRGDSLSGIAARYNSSVSELMALNNLQSRHKIRIGQVVNLPHKAGAPAIPADADTYVVRSGDTFGEIALRAGVSQQELLAMNSLSSGNRIYSGQQLIIRGGGSSAGDVTEPVAGPVVEPVVIAVADAAPAELPEADANIVAAEPEIAFADEATLTIVESGADADTSVAEADQLAEAEETDAGLLADPSDYLVAADATIEIQAAETLGHYADWLGIRTQTLRNMNDYSFRQPVVIGRRLRLDFDEVNRDEFVERRLTHHRELQEAFFARYRIVDTQVHSLRRGESLFVLSLRQYKVPVWLLRQYNPDLDIDRLRPGTDIVFPQIERVSAPEDQAAMARAEAGG